MGSIKETAADVLRLIEIVQEKKLLGNARQVIRQLSARVESLEKQHEESQASYITLQRTHAALQKTHSVLKAAYAEALKQSEEKSEEVERTRGQMERLQQFWKNISEDGPTLTDALDKVFESLPKGDAAFEALQAALPQMVDGKDLTRLQDLSWESIERNKL